ncbi:MAG: hypothetical protein OXD35_15355, partial [Thiotrichales bacterium]|nr:hypothetical protein [Thiotrichales bacterium]
FTAPSAEHKRRVLAKRFHIHTLLTCHCPENVNLSQNTAINESLIVMRRHNEWLLEQTLTREDFVLDGDEAIDRAGHGKTHPAQLLKTVLIAALPDTPAPKDRENTIVEQFIQRMHHDGLRTIAEDCHQEWTLHDTRQIYQEAREIIEGDKSIARHTEQRRATATRLAAREAGYER